MQFETKDTVMLEWDASLALRVEIIETAISALYDTLPSGAEARAELVRQLNAKIADAEFAAERRHELERAVAHISKKL